MVSEKKKKKVTEIKELLEKYPIIGILDMFKMPSRQLQYIRKGMREKALIRMCKKRLIKRVLKEVKKENIEKLMELDPKEPALIFSEMDPFKLFKTLKDKKYPGYAKGNDVAPKDIVVPAGSTGLMAGPAIGDLKRINLPTMVKEGRIHIMKDTVVTRKGEIISFRVAEVLKKLDIKPIKIGVDLLGVWENKIVYRKDVLDVDEEECIQKILKAHTHALNLSVNVCYLNEESLKVLMLKAYQHAKNLGINAKILDKGVVEGLLKKANVQGLMLKEKLKV